MQTLLFAFTELSTSAVLFLYVPAIWSAFYQIYQVTILIEVLFITIPLIGAYQLSKRMLGSNSGYFSIDYRINLSHKCHELSTLTDMVRSRRRLVIVNIIYVLVTTSAMTIILYCYDLNPLCIIPNISLTCYDDLDDLYSHRIYRMMFVILVWYTACIISLLQNVLELFFIFTTKKCFLNWAFKEGLEEIETLARIKEQERVDKLEEYNLFQRE